MQMFDEPYAAARKTKADLMKVANHKYQNDMSLIINEVVNLSMSARITRKGHNDIMTTISSFTGNPTIERYNELMALLDEAMPTHPKIFSDTLLACIRYMKENNSHEFAMWQLTRIDSVAPDFVKIHRAKLIDNLFSYSSCLLSKPLEAEQLYHEINQLVQEIDTVFNEKIIDLIESINQEIYGFSRVKVGLGSFNFT